MIPPLGLEADLKSRKFVQSELIHNSIGQQVAPR